MEKCGLEFYSSLDLRCPVSLAGCPATLDNELSEFPIFQNLVLVKIGGGANHFELNSTLCNLSVQSSFEVEPPASPTQGLPMCVTLSFDCGT
jgi:hypothetical protein